MNKKNKVKQQIVYAADPLVFAELEKNNLAVKPEEDEKTMLSEIIKSLKSLDSNRASSLAFHEIPRDSVSGFDGLYRGKNRLVPDELIKIITGPQGDELVNQIIQARSNHVASCGRPRASRFSIGFDFVPINKHKEDEITSAESSKIKEKMNKIKDFLWNCGAGPVDDEPAPMTLSQLFKQITRDGLRFGRFAVERIWTHDISTDGKPVLYAIRPVDASTIYKIPPAKQEDQSARMEALSIIREINKEKFDTSKYKKDEYAWTQIIDGKRSQNFTHEEMVVYNMYPVTDVEFKGYPLTPIDQALHAITTHVSITRHNMLYFQQGRAARGMLVFRSEDINESDVQKIRLQFNASINSVNNAWRLPVFGIGPEDEISWQAIDAGGRDGEFQYLMDNNARVILSAFQMSPEELPGYAHLARGTNSQALSESANEWKLTAARDVGLRPLLYDIQDFINIHVLPFIDAEFSKEYQFVFAGLEKDDPEKEATRLQQDQAIHLTYNNILELVEKPKLAKHLGGDIPLNQLFKSQVIDPYMTVGQVLEYFFGIENASKDPRYNYIRDPFWMQYQQIIVQKAQMAMQQEMMQQQTMMQQQMAVQQNMQTGQSPSPDEGAEANPNMVKSQWQPVDYIALEKTIKDNNSSIGKMIYERHKALVDKHMEAFKQESRKALENIEKTIGAKKRKK
jgi:hypothetical protein